MEWQIGIGNIGIIHTVYKDESGKQIIDIIIILF